MVQDSLTVDNSDKLAIFDKWARIMSCDYVAVIQFRAKFSPILGGLKKRLIFDNRRENKDGFFYLEDAEGYALWH